jgi:arylsulfatase A-like enzyme
VLRCCSPETEKSAEILIPGQNLAPSLSKVMISQLPVHKEPATGEKPLPERAVDRPGPLSILLLSAWCGLISGLLEVGITIVRKRTVDLNQFYLMSRHFVWLIPLTNLLIFIVLGAFLSLMVRCNRRSRWLGTRVLGTMTLLPLFWTALPRIYAAAGFLVVLGAAMRMVPSLERRGRGFARLVRLSFPMAAALWVLLAASPWGMNRFGEWRETSQSLPAPGSPNVLLIVLDTVGAGHLSLYGYHRATSPVLAELAAGGIRFDNAQATSPWTLPSHASMFTGRWPHELSAGWLTPLDHTYPTVAEFLGSRGYATAGFTANQTYCASDSGLARGFARFEDYIFPELTAFHMAVLVDHFVEGVDTVSRFMEDWLDIELLKPASELIGRVFRFDRKEAAVVNGEFLDWLSRRPQKERPFFAFLNYYDAHHPYQLSRSGIHRFGVKPRNKRELAIINDWKSVIRQGASAQQIAFARDAYEDCIAELDEHLGMLIDELRRRSILERTWLILVADHGENFGEHAGVFLHGATLYRTERHVPLVIVPPAQSPSKQVVTEAVSLRDLAATIVDVVRMRSDSPFTGRSLARFWNGEAATAGRADFDPSDQALSEVVPVDPLEPNPPRDRERRWPLAALTEGDWTYIRREGEVREGLFHRLTDPGESQNIAGDPAAQSMLEKMRKALDRLTGGPLTPERFSP